MALATQSSVQSFGSFQEHQNYHNRPYSSLSFTTPSESTNEQSMINRRESVATMESVGQQVDRKNTNMSTTKRPISALLPARSHTHHSNRMSRAVSGSGGGNVDLRKQATQKMALKQHRQQQQQQRNVIKKSSLPLFPTERTRGAVVPDRLQPVDITKIDLMPIEVSRGIIMSCIDEIKLRGLTHKYLFRNAFYSPSVEASLDLLKHPRKRRLFSVKALRIDTVGGLLTTVLSRTYPPLIPPHIQELFENPNGRFFFELLGLLPELNRYLFVEILDLCCELADRQSDNHVSHSKLAIYPGSCCFGLEEYMPTWDTRYLMTPDLKKFSEAFYNIIYAYREERDLSAEQLQMKLDKREKVLAEERLEMLEQEHGLEGAHNILKREARIAQGLPPDSPPLPVVPTSPSDLKEVSLYAGRKEKVVADDAISVLDIEIDQENQDQENHSSSTAVSDNSHESSTSSESTQGEEENEDDDIEKVMADLRRSVSVATLGYWSDNSSNHSGSTSSLGTNNVSKASSTSSISFPQQQNRYALPVKVMTTIKPRLTHTKSLARFGSDSLAQNQFPVSPGDIFGISRHAIEQRELQQFLAVARTFTRRKSFGHKGKKGSGGNSKRISQWRLQNKRLRPQAQSSRLSSFIASHLQAPIFVLRRVPHHRNAVLLQAANSNTGNARGSTTFHGLAPDPFSNITTRIIPTANRRGRTRQIRKELEVYLSQGLTKEEALVQREQDARRRKRDQKRAKARAAREAQLALERQARAEARAEAERQAAKEQEQLRAMTMEETEVLEAFDYLTDAEFEEFIFLAGLTHKDVERIREKAAAAALEQVTVEIQATDRVQQATAAAVAAAASATIAVPENTKETKKANVIMTVEIEETITDSIQEPILHNNHSSSEVAITQKVSEGSVVKTDESAPITTPMTDYHRKRHVSPQHMTSMELLIKNTAVIGDSNLRCYPVPSNMTLSESELATSAALSAAAIAASNGLLSQAATVMTAFPTEDDQEIETTSRSLGTSNNRSSVSLLITKGIPHLERHNSSTTFSSSSSSSSFVASTHSDVDADELDDEDDDRDEVFHDALGDHDDSDDVVSTTSTTSTTTMTATTSGNVHILAIETVVVEEEVEELETSVSYMDQTTYLGEALETLSVHSSMSQPHSTLSTSEYSDLSQDMDEEEATELRELLDAMTPEERYEFLRLSQ